MSSDQALSSLSCGPFRQVWATGKNGCAYSRMGIKEELLEGEKWQAVEPPNGAQLKRISIGPLGIWGLGTNGRLFVRKEITEVFPEGTHWQCISADPPILSKSFLNSLALRNKLRNEKKNLSLNVYR